MSVPDSSGPYLVINNVRISPAEMVFENAYEGKVFCSKLVIQNCGDHLVLIRLCQPSSNTFKFRSFEAGIYLSPGMRIVRTVTYRYTIALGVLNGFVTIWVNEKEIDYHFVVTLSRSILSIEPSTIVDFGRIDAVNLATSRTFYLKNAGSKTTQFAIDLGHNPLELTVEPMRGTAPAHSSVAIKIEIVGSHEGEFTEEIWVKTSPPQRVVVTGTFISPKLLVKRFITSLDFLLVEFPPTYCGSSTTKSLLIKNFSSSHSMFCLMAEIQSSTMTLDEARRLDENYKNFTIQPLDGRLPALGGALIQITFAPITSKKFAKNYSACFLKCVRMDCRDVVPDDAFYDCRKELRNTNETSSFVTSSRESHPLMETVSFTSVSSDDGSVDEPLSFEHAIKICLHGEKEVPSIEVRPDTLFLKELVLNQMYQRELLISNKSKRLPIRVRYIKTTSIEVVPKEFDLDVNGEREVLVKIKTVVLDVVKKVVTFDLLAKDKPDDQKIFRKVGTISLNIEYDTTSVVIKKKLKQCWTCHDLKTKLDPEFPFKLNPNELQKKIDNENYYYLYLKSLQKNIIKNVPEYDITDHPFKLKQCSNFGKSTKVVPLWHFIPLPPRLLYNIKINPKSIRIQKVATHTTVSDFFEITNLNAMPIGIFVGTTKPCINFDQNRYYIQSNEIKKIVFTFSTTSIGWYYTTIMILVNDSTLFEVTAVANVVPKTLKIESNHVKFGPNDGHLIFFKMLNTLNAYTGFEWDVPDGCFKIHPKTGGIKAESFMYCMITYDPDPYQASSTECVLTSESGQKRIVTISTRKREPSVIFDSYELNLGLIPLNVVTTKKLVMKNLSNFQVYYNIPSGIEIPGTSIVPKSGFVEPLDCQVFLITVHIATVIDFKTNLVFEIEEEEIVVTIKGSVEYPLIRFQPNMLHFRKISPYSYDSLAFEATNLSKCEAVLTFVVEESPEFVVTAEEDEHSDQIQKIHLEPDQTKMFYLHFQPCYVCTYSFYLPIKINDILGPVYINSSSTSSPLYFLKEVNGTYGQVDTVLIKSVPKFLPVVRVNCSATERTLELSQTLILLTNVVPSSTFEITNVSTDMVQICIRIDELREPFELTPIDANYELNEVSYRLRIEPSSKAIFRVNFVPNGRGEYRVKLPIFLRHYSDNRVFNFLTLRGVYPLAKISTQKSCYYFEPVPLRTLGQMEIELQLSNHDDNCQLSSDTEEESLFVIFGENKDGCLSTTLQYQSSRNQNFDSNVHFFCCCGATCTIRVMGVADNCLLTTHVFSHFIGREVPSEEFGTTTKTQNGRVRFVGPVSNKNTSTFPLFPLQEDCSEYASYMRSLKKTLEQWIFTQIFYYKCYYRIPEGFSDHFRVQDYQGAIKFGGTKRPAQYVDLPILVLLGNVAGTNVRTRLAVNKPKTESEKDWLIYTWKTNNNVLSFLQEYSVWVPHLDPRFLLNYEQYCSYQKFRHPLEKKFDKIMFHQRSTQCWIDLILQIIKTFFLYRTVKVPDPVVKDPSIYKASLSSFAFSKMSNEDELESVLEIGIYGTRELLLMDWLLTCYNKEKGTIWKNAPPNKELIYFDEDLRDGLILGAVTAYYCPYIKQEIGEMYAKPYNPEELFHNVCVLIRTWKMLHLSYEVQPFELQNNGMVSMLMLVDYLYHILPNCSSSETITIVAPLTQTNYATINLENLGQNPISYQIVFFGNTNSLFSVAAHSFVVEPKGKRAVRIKYHAKSVTTTQVTILFSGETHGFKYGKSVAVSLVGIADVSYTCMQIALTVDLYKLCEVQMQTESPFKKEADYSLLFGYQPVSKERNLLFPWSEMKVCRTNKEFLFHDDICKFDGEGKCTLKQLFCLQQKGPRDIFLYFANSLVGDWGIQITLKGRVTNDCYENLIVVVPKNYQNFVCRCSPKPCITTNCPMLLKVLVPMKNNPLWDARKKMILSSVEGEEFTFWANRIYTPTGTRILKLLFNSETHPTRRLIEDSGSYKIVLETKSAFLTLANVIFDDVISDGFFELPIHPLKNFFKQDKYELKLVSSDGTETRFYYLFVQKIEE